MRNTAQSMLPQICSQHTKNHYLQLLDAKYVQTEV